MQSWILLSLLAGLASVLFNYFNRLALKDYNDSSAFAWWFELFRILIFIPLLIFDHQITWTSQNILTLLSVGAAEFFSVYLFMKMHALNELSISSIIVRLRVVWIPLMAILVLGEQLSSNQYLGIAVLFIGMATAMASKKVHFDKGIKIAFLFSIASSLLSVFQKKGALIASTPIVVIAMSSTPLLLFPFILKSPTKRIKKSFQKHFKLSLAGAFANVVGMYLLFAAFRLAESGRVMAIYQSTTILSVLSGIILLKERKHTKRRIIGAILTIIGVLLLI